MFRYKKKRCFFLWRIRRNSNYLVHTFIIGYSCDLAGNLFLQTYCFYHWNAGKYFRFSASVLTNLPPYLILIIFIIWLLITMSPNKLCNSMNITKNKNSILLKVHILIYENKLKSKFKLNWKVVRMLEVCSSMYLDCLYFNQYLYKISIRFDKSHEWFIRLASICISQVYTWIR